ncbi:MAG: ATP-dependent DNA ligase [Nitrososphaerota archaeon]
MSAFREFTRLCSALESENSRNNKVLLLANYLRTLKPEDVAPAALMMIGRTAPERSAAPLNVGWSLVRTALESGPTSMLLGGPLTISEVWSTFENIAKLSGPKSREKRRLAIQSLFTRASDVEREWLLRLLSGEMRHGVNRGLLIESLALMTGVSPDTVRRADMFLGDLMELSSLAARRQLDTVGVKVFTPVRPMLAQMAENEADALGRLGGTAYLNPKYDGVRVQIHKSGPAVRVYTRRLQDITGSLPDVVSHIEDQVQAGSVILDGEVYGVDRGGRPLPFQDTMRRVVRERETDRAAEAIPLELKIFDILYLEGVELWWKPLKERLKQLQSSVESPLLAEFLETSDRDEAGEFYRRALRHGYEGVMFKDPASPYSPGRRGGHWLKLKKVDYLDVVIVAAEWGHGRRRGWLSNYHLAVRDEGGGFKIVGKTFKGLTDDEFREMTRRLLSIRKMETSWGVVVEPRVVVEVAYSEVQRSPHYPSGYALRFARITRIRDDKDATEVDTLNRLREIYMAQKRPSTSI